MDGLIEGRMQDAFTQIKNMLDSADESLIGFYTSLSLQGGLKAT